MNTSLLPFAYLLPLGLLLTALGSTPRDRLRESLLAALVITVASVVAYIGFGFALQFGGIGLSPTAPAGLVGLDKVWSPFPASAGRWSFAGLEGFFGEADGVRSGLALVETLLLHRLPMAIAAGLIPVIALGDRVQRVALIAAGIVSTAIVFPIVGAWVWGGGWLGLLGLNLNLGHGAIDAAGSGVVFFASACVAFVALRLFRHAEDAARPVPTLPMTHQPLLTLLGAVLFGAGWSAWIVGDPLLITRTDASLTSVAATGLISASTALIVVSAYIWLVTGRLQLLMAVRGWLAGWIAAGAAAWFIPLSSASVIGAIAGSLFILGRYTAEARWRLNDRADVLALSGAAGAWGLIALGVLADGAFGSGWNGVDVAQGVRGVLASDPGQLTAQLAALAAIGALAVCVAALLLFPFALLTRRAPAVLPIPLETQPALDTPAATPPHSQTS
ncbi:MAG TPA: hypothetical protein VJG32_05705 [Anaerolineae bacterium]|nr:hypothetical protein [Anaerolineae bacterium]